MFNAGHAGEGARPRVAKRLVTAAQFLRSALICCRILW
jgi:hypothetical protein